MSNGTEGMTFAELIARGLQFSNDDLLVQARRVVGYKESAMRKQSSAIAGELAAREYMKREYRGRAREIAVPRRGRRGRGAPILDLLFETGDGEFVLIEAKANESPLGKTQGRRFEHTSQGLRVVPDTNVPQMSPQWFEERLAELRSHGPNGEALAKRLKRSWRSGKLRPLVVHAPLLRRGAYMTTEIVELPTDLSNEFNEHVGAQNRHTLPSYNVKAKPITDPARLLDRPTNGHRNSEAATRSPCSPIPPFNRRASRRRCAQDSRAWIQGSYARDRREGVESS
jgi:hypothetical protein